MLAAVYRGKGDLRVEQVPVPEILPESFTLKTLVPEVVPGASSSTTLPVESLKNPANLLAVSISPTFMP